MAQSGDFNFGSDNVAAAYDTILVPLIFEPWAESLLGEHPDWEGRTVLDLATGTGIVAQLAARRVGPTGRVIATDLNPEMLERARQRCSDSTSRVEFSKAEGHAIAADAESIDIVLCQQGFQFFNDLDATANEISRVLRPGGSILASTWAPADECAFFGWICQTLAEVGEPELEAIMRLPFDHMPPENLSAPFLQAGFTHVSVERQSAPLLVTGGTAAVLEAADATPIGPKLVELPQPKREAFEATLRRRVESERIDETTMGDLSAHVLKASKPAA